MEKHASDAIVRVGKYRLLHELGRGGMGVVYLAEDTRLLRQVALKVLHPALTLDTAFVARFASEAQAIAALTHPGIVRVHAFEEVDGSHLIDMEYIDGRSLDQIIARGPVAKGDAFSIMFRVLEALAACHARSMVHRDIKPSNVLIAYDGRVLLSDFGLAMSFALASASGATSSCFIGTPKYAPPESWDRVPPSPAGDVYSAGLVMLELMAGKTPYDGDSPLEIMRKTATTPGVPVRALLPEVSNELVRLLEEMLATDPKKRPAEAGIALQRLRETPEFAAMPDEGAQTLRITPPGVLSGQRAIRGSAWRWLAVVGAIAVAAGTFHALTRQPRANTTPVDTGDVASALSAETGPSSAPAAGAATPSPEAAPATTPRRGLSPHVGEIVVTDRHVIFVGNTQTWRTLWSYDTTTGAVVPIWPQLTLGIRDTVFKDGGRPAKHGLVGVVRTKSNGIRLFRTDGTPEGTVALAFAADAEANRFELLGAHDGIVYFNRIGGDDTFGLWQTDGSIEGTRHVWGGIPEATISSFAALPSGGFCLGSATNATLYFWPPGAAEPTPLLGPHERIANFMGNLTVIGEQVLVDLQAGASGRELWFGTPEPGGLQLVRDIAPGEIEGVVDPGFGRFGTGVVFAGNSPEHGREPWITDGTEAGTRLLCDVNPGPMGSGPYRFTEAGGLLFFSAMTPEHGQELWVSDGTAQGTRRLTDINPGVASTDPFAFCAFQNGLLFTPNDPVNGNELWFSDGTPEGTRVLHDCLPGPGSGGPHGTQVIGARAVFSADHPMYGRVLWETDGTSEGTRPLFERLEGEPAPGQPTAPWTCFAGRVYMANRTPEYGAELWATDLATGASVLVRDIHPGPAGSHPREFHVFDGQLFFVADDGIHGAELWRTDGTRDGTYLVFDATAGIGSGNPHEFTPWGENRLAFTAYGGRERGHAIFYLVPGRAGAQLAGGTDRVGTHWRPFSLLALSTGETGQTGESTGDPSGWLLFSNQNADGDTTLWRTDGGQTVGVPVLGRGDAP